MDERTIKKLWEGLEDAGLIRFTPRDWTEKRFITKEDGEKEKISFVERWKERRKHPDTYYEIPITKETLFRKIPKETLILLNERYNVNELTMKIYITMINYQEQCCYENISIKRFTYRDLRTILGYAYETTNNRKFEDCLRNLESLGLIELDTGEFKNSFGAVIPCFVLKQANFYINYKIKDFETGEECAIGDAVVEKIKEINTELYPESFK